MNSSENHSSNSNPSPAGSSQPLGDEQLRQPTSAAADADVSAQPDELLATQLSETEWLAFCYLADELPADQRQAFEQRLESDPEAQQALLVQLELTEQIVSASQPVVAATNVTAQTPAAVSIPNVLDTRGLDAQWSNTDTTKSNRVGASPWPARSSRNDGGSARTSYRAHWLAFAASLLLAAVGWFVWQGQQNSAERQLAAEWASRVTADLAPEDSQNQIDAIANAGDPLHDDELSALGLELLAWEREREPTSEPASDPNDADDNDWIFSAAMALEDEDFEWLQGTRP
jgi:hypothetical protein